MNVCFSVVVLFLVGGTIGISVADDEGFARLREYLRRLTKGGDDGLGPWMGSEIDGPSYNKRGPPSGFSAVRGKRGNQNALVAYLMKHGVPASMATDMASSAADYQNDFQKRVPMHGGFMASRGKRSSSQAEDSKTSGGN